MGNVHPYVILVAIIFATSIWIGGIIKEKVYEPVIKPIGCGIKLVFTGNGCEDKEDKT